MTSDVHFCCIIVAIEMKILLSLRQSYKSIPFSRKWEIFNHKIISNIVTGGRSILWHSCYSLLNGDLSGIWIMRHFEGIFNWVGFISRNNKFSLSFFFPSSCFITKTFCWPRYFASPTNSFNENSHECVVEDKWPLQVDIKILSKDIKRSYSNIESKESLLISHFNKLTLSKQSRPKWNTMQISSKFHASRCLPTKPKDVRWLEPGWDGMMYTSNNRKERVFVLVSVHKIFNIVLELFSWENFLLLFSVNVE